MKIAIIDNYDSFTYNLVHLVNSITGGQVQVYRNDMIGPGALDSFDGLILSPGPGIPDEAGQLKDIIRDYGTRVPVFGVCLGMQAIAEVYGGSLRNLPRVFHGVEKEILTTGTGHRIFRDIPQQFMAGRYHSWIVNSEDLPGCLNITAVDRDGEIMALAHSDYDICGVQFHPESILTPLGEKIMRNWLGM